MKKKTRKWKTFMIVTGVVIVLLIAFRLWLPYLVLDKVNAELKKIEGYTGSVRDIDLFLLAGSYTIKDIELNKSGGKIPVPFFAAKTIELSVEWKALLNGEIVGEIEVQQPVLNYVKGPTKATTQTSIDKSWVGVVDNLMPLRINRFTVHNGNIHYRDFHSTPKVDVEMTQATIIATNLTNVEEKETMLPSTVRASASLYEGDVKLTMRLNPLSKTPAFDMNAELTRMSLRNLNDFLKAYGNFDVEKGTFSLYAEAATRDNKIVGYAKPIIKDMHVAQWKKEEGNVLQAAWETVVEFAAWIFKNQRKDQIATQVQFEGSLKNPDVDTWSIIGEVLQNAFIKALIPTLENSISIGKVDEKKNDSKGGVIKFNEKDDDKKKKGGFLKRLFKKDDDKKDENRKEDEAKKDEKQQ
jgi:branched-subunit amino acid transport protein AzlD